MKYESLYIGLQPSNLIHTKYFENFDHKIHHIFFNFYMSKVYQSLAEYHQAKLIILDVDMACHRVDRDCNVVFVRVD